MSIFLILIILTQTQSNIDNFLKETAPHLNYLVCGSEILSDSKSINFGIEGNYSDYSLVHYDNILQIPSFNAHIVFPRGNFTSYLKLGFYPKTNKTNTYAPFLALGLNLQPKFSEFLVFRFSYGTLSAIEYFPKDPYFNYNCTNFHCLNLSLIGLKKISVFTPFVTAGLIPSYVSGKYRNDSNNYEETFSKLVLGWHLGLGFKLFFVKFNAEMVNRRLSASTSFSL
jgi:hypothetical protein